MNAATHGVEIVLQDTNQDPLRSQTHFQVFVPHAAQQGRLGRDADPQQSLFGALPRGKRHITQLPHDSPDTAGPPVRPPAGRQTLHAATVIAMANAHTRAGGCSFT